MKETLEEASSPRSRLSSLTKRLETEEKLTWCGPGLG